ncbi:hypothetical protein SteCoe_36474 [Stentor coeruleus]|uniref:Uncharacterized protein n=1 Tax=Stentor coeruleus TaxID=5963 RepID=A0A1R2AQ21_9CILI|nr:hypothetical protein SteCoe_36474 [Stentor coeruleus]
MEFTSCKDESRYTFKAMHPKVYNILMRIQAPSPVRLARDPLQPISGSLFDLPKCIPKIQDEVMPAKIERQVVSLNLSMNRMKTRRANLVN